jgi:tRNA(adenine34) deaminase
MNIQHKKWMQVAIEEGENAIANGEVPISCVLVANDELIAKGYTQVSTTGNPTQHGELVTLSKASDLLAKTKYPVTLYTTLEPCLMCLGAAMNCGIDTIIYALNAVPDGGTKFCTSFLKKGVNPPTIIPHIMKEESLLLFNKFINNNSVHFGLDYVKRIVNEQPAII